MTLLSRRSFLAASLSSATGRSHPVILLRSGWQTENIGDIAHTPGVLRVLQRHLPDARVILWSNAVDRGVGEMLVRGFPGLEIVSGDVGPEDAAPPPTLAGAFRRADFLLHGSGPGVVARTHVEAWRRLTGKPYGFFGVTVAERTEAASAGLERGLLDLLSGARFVYVRETASLENLRRAGLQGPEMAFVPDGTFSFHLRDEQRAEAFLRTNGLRAGRFIACVPRLRYTPYHRMRKTNWTEAEIRRREEVNARSMDSDHARLRAAISWWVRQTGNRVLLCPEMTYQLDLLAPLLYDPLPDDVKRSVVRREQYWLPDEAASVYARAAAVLSFECHSPILAAANGTPGLYLRQPEDGIKGQMWSDLGLGNWCLRVDETPEERVVGFVRSLTSGIRAARKRVADAVGRAQMLQAKGAFSLRSLFA